MPRAARLAGILLCVSMLVSCSDAVRQQANMPESWHSVHAQRSSLDDWSLRARMAVQSEHQGGTLDVFWQQRGQEFEIRLIAPLGQGAMQLKGNSQRVLARLADGQMVSGAPDQLLQQAFGVSVPVSALVSWLRGIAHDNDYQHASWDQRGDLHRIKQLGWKVEMREYQQQGDARLPTRFYLETDPESATNIRFIVRSWTLQG